MRAIRINKFGPSNVLQVQEVNKPNVTHSKVLVKIKSIGINPVDTYIREGKFSYLPDLPFTPGKDASGVIEAFGENVTNFKVGQRVFICGRSLGIYGTYAEYTLVDEKDVFILDDKLTFDQGAALGIPYFTAYRAFVIVSKCKPNETVLIHGASGAVGLASVQIAKFFGLKIFGTAGTKEGMQLVKENGADYIFNHKDKNYLEKLMEITDNKGVNIVVEMLSNVNLAKDLEILAKKGRVAIVGCQGQIKINPRSMMLPETSIHGVALLSSTEEEWQIISSAILRGIQDGWVKPVVDKKYKLEHAAEAHDYIMHSPGAKGKIVINLED